MSFPGARGDLVSPRPGDEHVVAGPAAQRVRPRAPDQRVVAVLAGQQVGAVAAEEHVVEGAALEPVGAVTSVERVAPVTAQEHVVAGLPRERVVEPGAIEAVVPVASTQPVAAVGAREDVGARAPDEHGARVSDRAQRVGAFATLGTHVAVRTARRELVVAGAADQRRAALDVVVPRSAVEHRRARGGRPQRVGSLTARDVLDVERHPVALARLAAHPARARDDADGCGARRVAERVDAGTALLVVAARARQQEIVARQAEQRVVARVAAERVPSRRADHDIVARAVADGQRCAQRPGVELVVTVAEPRDEASAPAQRTAVSS